MISHFSRDGQEFLYIGCDEPGCLTSTRNMGRYFGVLTIENALLLWREHGGVESVGKQYHYCRIHKSSNKN